MTTTSSGTIAAASGRPSLADRAELIDLLVRYTTCLDGGDVEGVVDCFFPDGVIESPISGRYEGADGVRFFAEKIATHMRDNAARYRHFISNFRVAVAGDDGRVECYLLDYVVEGGTSTLLSIGEYDCRCRRGADGAWRIVHRLVRMDTPFVVPWLPAETEVRSLPGRA